MPLDSATFVGALDETIPADGNFVYEGDDHIRTIKLCLVNTFPNLAAACGAEAADLPKGKKNATTAPTVNDDSGDGYGIGSIWVDTTNKNAYICVDASVGAAVWQLMSGFVANMEMMFFQASTAVMTGWTFQAKDEDYVIRPGDTNTDGGTTSGTPDNTGWAISGLSGPSHTHSFSPAGTLGASSSNLSRGDGLGGILVAMPDHVHTFTGSGGTTGAGGTGTVTATGAWRPPTMFGTIWRKN